ncbi:MORN repeat-containing protein [Butyrivibrio sp. Su6]|uniref:hypothetical protein n=1 Tax=Butyrivibrio sp. Su6 TaxID=1520810 RepID=UPI00089F1178|nr:hypothetical protein [Butyrivibrio sp. Su6]SEF39029.1 MORN repeat-containing protein [Butyrivibrio sp. Su6]
MQNLFTVLVQTIKSRWAGLVSKLKLLTNWNFIRTKIIAKIRDFFYSFLNLKPRNKNDYITVFGWMISRRLVHAMIIVIGVLSIYYIASETSIFKQFGQNGGIKTYKYDSVRLRLVSDNVRITGKSGYLAYEGQVEKGYVTGKGTLYSKEGNVVYEGDFVNNKYEGQGLLNYPSGNTMYTGQFHDNLFDGEGTLYREDGTFEYIGEFDLGEKNGKGVLYDNGENEIYSGAFSSDSIVYSELLGKTVQEAADYYKGSQVLYQMDDDIAVYMKQIEGVYYGKGEEDSLDDSIKIESVYVLKDYFGYGNTNIDTITKLKSILGDPIYEGNSTVVFPEVVCINKLNESENSLSGRVTVSTTELYSDVIEVNEFDNKYVVYIYSFRRGDLIYSFVCKGQGEYFDFYYVSAADA